MMRLLRALIAVVVLVGVIAVADEILDESRAIAKIEVLGGKVTRDDTRPGRPVVEIDFQGNPRFNEKYLQLMMAFPHLSILNLSGTIVTDDGLNAISNLKSLVEVDLSETGVTAAGIARLREASPRLTIIEASAALRTIADLGGVVRTRMLADGPELTISFDGNEKFTDESAHLLKSVKQTKGLVLSNTKVTDAALKELRGLKNLTTLLLRKTQVTDKGMMELRELKHLSDLDIRDTQVTDSALSELGALTSLVTLDLSGTKVTDPGLKELHGLVKLRNLSLQNTRVTDDGLKELQHLKNLDLLALSNDQITDMGIKELKLLDRLEWLYLDGTSITDECLTDLSQLKPLKRLFLLNTKITRAGLTRLKKARPDLITQP